MRPIRREPTETRFFVTCTKSSLLAIHGVLGTSFLTAPTRCTRRPLRAPQHHTPNPHDPREVHMVGQHDAGRTRGTCRDPDVIRGQRRAGRSQLRDNLPILARHFRVNVDRLDDRVRQEVSQACLVPRVLAAQAEPRMGGTLRRVIAFMMTLYECSQMMSTYGVIELRAASRPFVRAMLPEGSFCRHPSSLPRQDHTGYLSQPSRPSEADHAPQDTSAASCHPGPLRLW